MKRTTLWAGLAAALTAAVVVPGHSVGLGVVTVVAIATVALIPTADLKDPWFWTYGLLCWGLVLPALFVAAEWVVGPALAGAGAMGALALAPGSTPLEILAAMRVPSRVIKGARYFAAPMLEGAAKTSPRGTRIARSAIVSVALVAVFGALFVSADRAFAHIIERAFAPGWDVSLLPARIAVACGVCAVIGALGNAPVLARPDPWFSPNGPDPFAARERKVTWNEWAVPLALLDVLFAAFVAVQFAVLFGGHTHVLTTAGLTYAEYARQGFFQLLMVGGLTLGVVLTTVVIAKPTDEKQRRVLYGLLGVLCALTIVILVSALKRLGLYESAFGYTVDRFIAHSIVLWLGGIFVLVMAAGVRRRGDLLPRAIVILTAVIAIVIAFTNPERLIATRNVERYEATGKIDTDYLQLLGPDAAPALARLPESLRACVLPAIVTDTRYDGSSAGFNFSRSTAEPILENYRLEVPTC